MSSDDSLTLPSRDELRQAREQAGLSRSELADRIGKSREWIRYVENGYEPTATSYDNLERLVDALNDATED